MNTPKTILDQHKNIMLIGIGGGFDVFVGLPFVYNMPDKNFILVNSSPSNSFHFRESTEEDYPEFHIPNEPNIITKYTVGRHGTIAVQRAYEEISTLHSIDATLAVDGGVDSLSKGNEEDHGTILEDFIALAALKNGVLACAGFGTETEENLNHYRILQNIANLAAKGYFLGSFSMTKEMPEFQKYAQVCEATWGANKRKSHIQTKIISSVRGRFADENDYTAIDARVANAQKLTFISPLSSIYWMFDLEGVINENLFIKALSKGNTFADCKMILRSLMSGPKRSKEIIPL